MPGFEEYVADLEAARNEAVEAVETYERCKDAKQREDMALNVTACLDEVERYLRILEDAASHEKSAQEKRHMMEKTRHHATQLSNLKSRYQKAILLADSRAAVNATATTSPHEQIGRCVDRMDRTGRQLDEAQRTLADTEAIAANAANNLLQQRNQLEHAEIDVRQAQEDTEEAGSHLRRMLRKALANKILLILVILALCLAIALVSYYKWYPRNKKDVLHILPTTTPTATSAS